MARGWSRNLSRAGRPFQDPRKEGAFQRFFAHSYLPWDVTINCVLLACIALHAQLMLEATALGCNRTVSGPGWFQGTTLSRWISSSSDQAETATAAAVQHARSSAGHRCTSPPDNAHIDTIMRGQCAAAVLAYPCSEAWPYRVHFAWRNWQQLSAAALSNPATQRLWWSHVLPLVATSAAVVLLCLVGSAFVLVNRHRQSNSSSPGAAEASSSRSSNAATPAASSEMLKHAASVPAWWPRLRNISTALLSLLSGMAVSVALLLDPLPPHLLPWSLAYVTSSAGGGMFAEATAVATLVFMLPLHYHMPTMLLKWAAMTAGGCLVDRQLLGSAAAGWRTYAWSFTCIVVASSVAVAWVEGGMRRRFAAAWAAQGGRSAQCTAAEARALQGGGLSKACSSAADAPDGAAPQAAGAAAGASSAAAAAAEVVSTAGSGGGSKAAAAIMAAPLPARAAVPRRSSLYSTTRAGRQVTLSVKVLTPHEGFAAAAMPRLAHALAAVDQAAQAMRLGAAITNAAAFPGCVQLLLEVNLTPGEGPAAGRAVQAMTQAVAARLAELTRQQQEETLVEALHIVPAADPVLPSWRDWPCCALVNPVCIAAAAAGQQGGARPLHIGLFPGAAARLPGQPRVVVTGHCLRQGTVSSLCRVLPSSELWSPAGPGPKSLLSMAALPETDTASAVLLLHVLDAAADAGSPSAAAHPLASLPLLCLPPAAAEEVLGLFARMVQEVAEAAGAEDQHPLAARQAYWQHFVPFVYGWRSLLLLAAHSGDGAQHVTDCCPNTGAAATSRALGTAAITETASGTLVLPPAAVGKEALPELQDQAADLLAFLSDQRMTACLEVAQGLAARAGQVVASRTLQGAQPGLAAATPEGACAAALGAASAGIPSADNGTVHMHAVATTAAGSSAAPAAAQGSAAVPAESADGVGTGSRVAAAEVPASSPSTRPPSPLTWRCVLLGFPDAAIEAAYLAFKNTVYLAQVDTWSSVISLAFMAALLLQLLATQGWRQGWAPMCTVLLPHLMYSAPRLLMRLNQRFYQKHREVLLVLTGGPAVAMFMLGNGMFSLLLQGDSCTLLPKCGVIMAVLCMQYPVVQQVRFLPAAVTSLLHGAGMALYAAYRTGSWLWGVAAGVAGAAAGMLVTAWLELRCRAAFVHARAAEPCSSVHPH